MKAARLHRIGEALKIDSVEMPEVGPNDVLVDIKASGICHSDLNYRDGVSPVAKLPLILGHEIAGLVSKTGERVRGIEDGDRVCVHYIRSCGDCSFCRNDRENFCEEYQMIGKDVDGGFAEYIAVPASNVLKLPSALPFEQACILGCAASTTYHALKRGRIRAGDTVVVYGVGGLGAQAIQLAKIFNAGKVVAVDTSDEKLKLAKKLGADELVNAAVEDPAERSMTEGKLADLVLDFVGAAKVVEQEIRCVGKGGRMVLVGIGQDDISISPYKTIIGKEMELIGVNDHLRSELAQLIEIIGSGIMDLSTSITHRVYLDEVNTGLKILEERIGNPIRVVVVK
ncbi:MAG: alcohol dehydrogenase catalytic domain-containing protein [Candidatus Bathyarchaeia archaeon]